MARTKDAKAGFRSTRGPHPPRERRINRDRIEENEMEAARSEGPRRTASVDDGELCELCQIREAVATFDVADVETPLCGICSANPDNGTNEVKQDGEASS